MKNIKKMIFVALEEALQNVSEKEPKFCNMGYCYRKKVHKGFCVMTTPLKKDFTKGYKLVNKLK